MEVSAVFHFFCEYIGWVKFPRDVDHIESFVLDPFMVWIFSKLNVASGFKSHVVWPLYASIVVIVQGGGRGDVVEIVAIVRNTAWKMLKVHHLFKVALVAQILASHELREFCSWCSPSHPVRPPFLKTMPPFIFGTWREVEGCLLMDNFPWWSSFGAPIICQGIPGPPPPKNVEQLIQ